MWQISGDALLEKTALENDEKMTERLKSQIEKSCGTLTADLIETNMEYLRENEPEKYKEEKEECWVLTSHVLAVVDAWAETNAIIDKKQLQDLWKERPQIDIHGNVWKDGVKLDTFDEVLKFYRKLEKLLEGVGGKE